MSKPGVFREAIDNDQNGEDILLKSKIKLEQKDRLKRAKKIDGDIKGKICFNRHGINHVVESRFFGANRLGINSGKSSSWPSESSRPQPPSLSPKESNTYDDVAVNQSNDVFKVKTAEGSDETPSRSLTGRKRKTEVTPTSPTNNQEKQYTPNDQSAKTPNLSVTTQYEQTYEKCVYVLSVSDGEATSFRCH